MSEITVIDNYVKKYKVLKKEIAKIIIGQDAVVEQILISIFSGGHVLLIGVPGLAKTLMVDTIAKTLGLDFKRIQFTPDLMPSDILGSEILDNERQFKFIKGPVFQILFWLMKSIELLQKHRLRFWKPCKNALLP